MSLALDHQPARVPPAATRLLLGLSDPAVDPGLTAHLERWGPSGDRGPGLINDLESSGLAGHGGAWFPVGTKWRAVAAAGRGPVVVANGAESEPASHKDAFLMARAPHLVLDGLMAAANALGATRTFVHVAPSSRDPMARALEERRQCGLDHCAVEIVEAPDRFLAGQESAVVATLNGGSAVPGFVGLRSIRDRGVGGRPTLVQNVETLAHVALINRFGAGWFREVGTAENPGTALLSLAVPDGPFVVEAVLGSSLSASVGLAAPELGRLQGVLLGGYGGGWVSVQEFAELPVLEKAARRQGATLGAGVVAPLPKAVCPLVEMADVVRYMEAQGAGQCGPCVHGLADLADVVGSIAYGKPMPGSTDRIVETANLIEGRGACRHPDGVARFVRSGLRVFADEVASHQRHGPCARTSAPRVLPIPNRLIKKRLVTRS